MSPAWSRDQRLPQIDFTYVEYSVIHLFVETRASSTRLEFTSFPGDHGLTNGHPSRRLSRRWPTGSRVHHNTRKKSFVMLDIYTYYLI
jgi:hypothetical protein